MNDETMYLHDVNLGEPMSVEEINRTLADHSDSPALRAVLHLLRNSTSDADRMARQEPEHRDLRCGQAVGCEDTFWAIVRACGDVNFAGEGGGGGGAGAEVPDPDEAEHAAGGEE